MSVADVLRWAGSSQPTRAPLLPRVTRRAAVIGATLGLVGGQGRVSAAETQTLPPQPDRMKRPKKGDKLVFAAGPNAGKDIAPSNLPEGGPQVMAWAADPATGVVRDGSRLNQVLVVRLAEDSLDEVTRQRAAGGVVAYSAICRHALCPVTEWRQDHAVLHCPCHNSEYDPRQEAKVVNGPAQRALASLPLTLEEGVLIVAAPFIGHVGAEQA